MAGKSKISGSKGIEICADLLFSGKRFGEIVAHCTEKYSVSESCVGKWIKKARPMVSERQAVVKSAIESELKQAGAEIAKELGLDLKSILAEYKKIGFYDIRKAFTVDGGLKPIRDMDDSTAGAIAGIESYDEKARETGEVLGTIRKIKLPEKKGALDSIVKILGYTPANSVELPEGSDLQSMTITFK